MLSWCDIYDEALNGWKQANNECHCRNFVKWERIKRKGLKENDKEREKLVKKYKVRNRKEVRGIKR